MNCSGISKSVSVMVIYFLFNIQTLKFFFQKTSSIFLFSLHSLTLCSIKVHVLGEKPKSFSNLLSFFYSTYRSLILLIQGVDLGGGGGLDALPPFLRDSTPYLPKGSPLWYFLRNPLLADRT